MDKDNEIYVTSNGELYKKGVEQAIYPQTNYTTQQFYTKEEYERLQAENEKLKFELKSEQKDNKYIKNCCIRAGKELEKYSFKWDGKEKNLVVQALELNEQYDKLQAENEELRQIRKDIPDIQQPYVIMYRNLKKELHNLQAENKRLKQENEEYKRYKYLFEKAREMKKK